MEDIPLAKKIDMALNLLSSVCGSEIVEISRLS